MQTVQEAQAALWDYINSLPPDRREKAIEYQRGLEAEAERTEGGMPVVIQRRVNHCAMLLQETIDEVLEIVANKQADNAIKKASS